MDNILPSITLMCWGTLAFVAAIFGIGAYFLSSMFRMLLQNLEPLVKFIAAILMIAFAVAAVSSGGAATPLEIIPVLMWIGSGGKGKMPKVKNRIG